MMHRFASIPGDGIGPEVTKAAKSVLDRLADKHGFSMDWRDFPNGAEHYLSSGEVLSDETIRDISGCEAVLLGALGDPRVRPGVLEKGILLRLRFAFDQYVNLRPVRFFAGIDSPISTDGREGLAIYFVRENTEDFYIGLGRRFSGDRDEWSAMLERRNYRMSFKVEVEVDGESESGYQLGVISRSGAQRIFRYAFELAEGLERRSLCCVDKANVLTEMYGLWRDVFEEVSKDYPAVTTEFGYVDAVAMNLVRRPERYSVIVTPNMFGDILTDLGAGIQGSLGLSPSGNINPEGISMFEPVHGSAPDIAGKGIANPVGAILAAQLMLQTVGEHEAATDLERAVYEVLSERNVRTPDLGGGASTTEMADAIADRL